MATNCAALLAMLTAAEKVWNIGSTKVTSPFGIQDTGHSKLGEFRILFSQFGKRHFAAARKLLAAPYLVKPPVINLVSRNHTAALPAAPKQLPDFNGVLKSKTLRGDITFFDIHAFSPSELMERLDENESVQVIEPCSGRSVSRSIGLQRTLWGSELQLRSPIAYGPRPIRNLSRSLCGRCQVDPVLTNGQLWAGFAINSLTTTEQQSMTNEYGNRWLTI